MNKIEREKQIVEQMIKIYCRHREGNVELCHECKELIEYALKRLSLCPFKNNKPTCRKCKAHCYNPAMRKRVRQVMRYSGPRMIIYHPIETIKHLF